MKTFLSITVIFFLSANVPSIAQVYYGFDESTEIGSVWNFYGVNYLSGPAAGKGNTGSASLDAGISSVSINPATFTVNDKFAFCLQSNYKANLTIPNPLFYPPDRYQNALPSVSFTLGYKLVHNIQVGLFYSNPISLRNISGLSGELTRVITYQKAGIPVSYSNGNINLGLSLEYSFYNSTISGLTQSSNHGEVYAKAEHFNFRFGCIYKLSPVFSFGASIEPGVSLKVNSTLTHIADDNFSLPEYPWKIIAGMEVRFKNIPLKLSFDNNLTLFSNNVDNYTRNFDNINIGAEYSLNNKIALRAGFFTLHNGDILDTYDQNYVTFGCGFKLGNFNIDAAVLHSHLYNLQLSNTILQTSIAYSF